jgi:hypothetical protein
MKGQSRVLRHGQKAQTRIDKHVFDLLAVGSVDPEEELRMASMRLTIGPHACHYSMFT